MVAVSVGVPTYNGADYLHDCLTSLVGQTHTDLEIIISDNASTDGTSEIAAEFARNHAHVRHVRADATISALENFRLAFDLAHAPYFLWRADDDTSSPTYIAALLAALDGDPSADLAVSSLLRVVDGVQTRFPAPEIDTSTPAAKVEGLLQACRPTWVYGMWRRGRATDDVFRMIREYPYYWAGDHMYMIPTILRGAVAVAADDGAVFQQNIVRAPTYALAPKDKLDARRVFKRIGLAELDALRYPPADHTRILRALEAHIEHRVARKIQTTRRAIEAQVRGVLGMAQRPNR